MSARPGAAWTVRPGRPQDTASVLQLFEATFGKPTTPEAYAWKFYASPWPLAASPAFVAAAGERVVGHLGGSPLRLRLGGRELPAVHICVGMVAEDVRTQGVMRAVHRAANEAWAAGGAEVALALPNHNWVRLRERLDYRQVFRLGWLWRSLRLPGPRGGRGIDVSPVETPGAEFDVLWEEAGRRYDAAVVRDRAWVRYRYAEAPAAAYRILLARARGAPRGYLVYRAERPMATIADVFAAPEDHAARSALVRAACRELRRERASSVRMFAVPGTRIHRELRRRGFLPRRGAYDVTVVPFAEDLPWHVLRDPERFFVMAGDFDVV
ncbi:MAG: GNAT family N-acetyltransferase [Gaiellaceae bacterium]